MKLGNRKWCLLLTAFLLMGIAVGLGVAAQPSRMPSKVIITHDPIDIDGDPSDWDGTPGADNTYVVSAGEGIWSDPYFDDTGNGSYIYPNCTHTDPPIPDEGGWEGYAYAYTGYPHGGMVDLREFRVTADNFSLYILLRFENMGSQEIAVEWNKDVHTNPNANDTNFGKILAQVYIDKDRVSGSGNTNATMFGNFEFDPACAWEVVINVAGDVLRGYPNVQLADGTVYDLNNSTYCYADCDIYPSAIEMKVPFSEIGDPRGGAWRFVVVVGGFDEGIWRQVWNTTQAISWGWPYLFRFIGGEGEDSGGVTGMGNDPNIIDMAFFNTSQYNDQEALLNSFTTGQLVVIDAYLDIYFDENGDVIPWVPIYSLPILLMVILYVKKKRLNRLVEHQ